MNTNLEKEDIEKIVVNLVKEIVDEIEDILKNAELTVRESIPEKYIKSALTSLEKAIEVEGIQSLFDKRVSNEMLRKTFNLEILQERIDELIISITKVVADETEIILKDVDIVCDELIEKYENKFETEDILKTKIESLMAAKGISIKLNRNFIQYKNTKIDKKDDTKTIKKRKITILENYDG